MKAQISFPAHSRSLEEIKEFLEIKKKNLQEHYYNNIISSVLGQAV